LNFNQKIVFTDAVFAQEIDGEMVLLDMNSENYFGLDEVGTAIWKAIEEKKMIQDVYETLLEEFDVEEEVLKKDLIDFIKELESSGLIEVKPL
jgi:hypothetical protein